MIANADHSTGGMSIDRNGNYKWNRGIISGRIENSEIAGILFEMME